MAAIGAYNPAPNQGVALLDQVVNQQAEVVAYSNDYGLLICTTLPALLLLLIVHRPHSSEEVEAEVME